MCSIQLLTVVLAVGLHLTSGLAQVPDESRIGQPAAAYGRAASAGSRREAAAARQDDLAWIIGRWRCIAREYLRPPLQPRSDADLLQYFNVYLPYADDHLTVALTGDPTQRPIAAELLAADLIETPSHTFVQKLFPINDSFRICIGTDRIWAGFPNALVFKYHRVAGVFPPQIVLESLHTRTVFEKIPLFSEDDMAKALPNSSVGAEVKEYDEAKRLELKARYEKLKTEAHVKDVPPTRSERP